MTYDIKVFRAEDICPKCKILIEKLKANNFPFTETTDLEEVINRGFRSAPVMCVNGNYLQFRDACNWIEQNK